MVTQRDRQRPDPGRGAELRDPQERPEVRRRDEPPAPGDLRRAPPGARGRGPARAGPRLRRRHDRRPTSTPRPPTATPRTGTSTSCGPRSGTLYPVAVTVDELSRHGPAASPGSRQEFLVEELTADAQRGVRPSARRRSARGDARARAPRDPVGPRPQVARAPLRDGLPAGGHRPAGDGPAGPAGRVPARGLRPVRRDDGLHQGGDRRLPVQPRGPGRGARAKRPTTTSSRPVSRPACAGRSRR